MTKIIGIAGGTASGKTTFANKLHKELTEEKSVIIPVDAYYHARDHQTMEERRAVNYDHPDALEISLLVEQLNKILNKESVEIPIYDYSKHTRSQETKHVQVKSFIIIEGILAFYFQELRELFDLKIFIDTDYDLRLKRRIERDVAERERTKEFALHQWNTTVIPMHQEFCEPTKEFADFVFNGVGDYQEDLNQVVKCLIK